jgi:hypothetical protein
MGSKCPTLRKVAMKRYQIPGLLIVAITAAFWAYTIMDSLIREFSKDVTYIDLGSIFILGLISGLALGLTIGLGRRKSPEAR